MKDSLQSLIFRLSVSTIKYKLVQISNAYGKKTQSHECVGFCSKWKYES